jgi:hypothetical protein
VDFELSDEQQLIQDTVRASWTSASSVAIQNIDLIDLDLIEGMASSGSSGSSSRRSTAAGIDYVPRRSPARRSSAEKPRSGR